MPERGIPGLWLLPESLEEVRLIFKANEIPLEKWPGILFAHVVHGSLSREGTKVAFLKAARKNLTAQLKPQGLERGGTSASLKDIQRSHSLGMCASLDSTMIQCNSARFPELLLGG